MRQACEGLWTWVLRFWEVSLGGRAGGREGQPATGLHPPTPPPRKNSSQAHGQGGLPWEAKPSVQSWVPPSLSGPLSLLARPRCTCGAPFWPDLTPHTGCQQRGQGRPHRLGQEAGALGTVFQRVLVENS